MQLKQRNQYKEKENWIQPAILKRLTLSCILIMTEGLAKYTPMTPVLQKWRFLPRPAEDTVDIF